VLTSGQAPTVLEGADLIAELVAHARGRIEILPGGGVSPKNISEIVRRTGVDQIHVASLAPRPERSTSHNPAIYYGGALYPPEDRYEVTDPARIKALAGLIKDIESEI
jgi:copper homeostasis protein